MQPVSRSQEGSATGRTPPAPSTSLFNVSLSLSRPLVIAYIFSVPRGPRFEASTYFARQNVFLPPISAVPYLLQALSSRDVHSKSFPAPLCTVSQAHCAVTKPRTLDSALGLRSCAADMLNKRYEGIEWCSNQANAVWRGKMLFPRCLSRPSSDFLAGRDAKITRARAAVQ